MKIITVLCTDKWDNSVALFASHKAYIKWLKEELKLLWDELDIGDNESVSEHFADMFIDKAGFYKCVEERTEELEERGQEWLRDFGIDKTYYGYHTIESWDVLPNCTKLVEGIAKNRIASNTRAMVAMPTELQEIAEKAVDELKDNQAL